MRSTLCCALCCTLRTPCARACRRRYEFGPLLILPDWHAARTRNKPVLQAGISTGDICTVHSVLCHSFRWRLHCLIASRDDASGGMLFNRSYFWVGVVQTSKDDEPAGNWQRIGCDENADTGMWWYPGEPNDDHGSEECAIAGVNIAEEWSLPSCADGCWFDAPCAPDASWQVACVCETHLGGSIQLEVLGALDAAARSVRASVRATDREALRTLVWILITLGLSAAPAFLTWLCITVSRKLKDSRQRSPRVYDLPAAGVGNRSSQLAATAAPHASGSQSAAVVGFLWLRAAGWVCIVFFVMFSVAIGALSGCEEDPSRLCPPIWPLKYLSRS